MNKRIEKLAEGCFEYFEPNCDGETMEFHYKKFAELIVADMHRKVIASILITDVLMEEKGQKPTSEDYIRAINKDFGVEE
jgi:superoxide dismutase